MTKTVVVTGGGTGIGRAITASFVSDGAHVVIVGRRAGTLRATAESLGDRVSTIVCDAGDADQVEEMREQLSESVDVLVNNAGGNRELEGYPEDNLRALSTVWRANLENNLVSAVLMTMALEKQLVPGGSVIHIGSFAADRGNGSYGAAKAGLASWNIYAANRLGRRGITSNVVSPGYIVETEFFPQGVSAEFHEARVRETMTGRAGRPEDVAGVVRFLASPAARQITGQVVHVNGGALTTR